MDKLRAFIDVVRGLFMLLVIEVFITFPFTYFFGSDFLSMNPIIQVVYALLISGIPAYNIENFISTYKAKGFRWQDGYERKMVFRQYKVSPIQELRRKWKERKKTIRSGF